MDGPSPAALPATPPRFCGARFRHAWRPYQARILEMMDAHLADDRLHVVAPPGSGKTVLGLEALRRLGVPAVVLTPTLTIREQWIERLLVDFACTEPLEPTLSRDLAEPGELCFTTYQGLYTLFHQGRQDAVIATLRRRGVGVLLVDEAHHLRAEWWRCLQQLKAALPGVRVLALTATPPFDAPEREWRRYREFCGDTDEEIGVPELVRDGNLCPHQDLLVLFAPDAAQAALIAAFDSEVRNLLADLVLDHGLADQLAARPEVQAAGQHVDRLVAQPGFWLAVAVYLGNLRWEVTRPLITALGLAELRLPVFDAQWAERLLHGLAIEQIVPLDGERRETLRHRLQQIGALDHGRLRLDRHPRHERLLVSATGMIEATAAIVQLELENFGARLRQLVLSDHIRAEGFPRPGEAQSAAPKLGVVPLFERLRRLRLPGLLPAIVTGRFFVLPRASLPGWHAALRARGVDADSLPTTPLWHDDDYLRIELDARRRAIAVPAVTQLFTQGDITLICGTTALLGEGWDAPAVNSLILATAVSAHVSANQLRGRGIRAQRGEPHKCANLWHLAGVPVAAADAPAPAGDDNRDHSPAEMRARFRGFVGLHANEDRIESGLARLGDCRRPMTGQALADWNAAMFAQARQVHQLATRWKQAIGSDTPGRGRVLRELRLPGELVPLSSSMWVRGARSVSKLPGFDWLLRLLARRHLRQIATCVATALQARGLLPAKLSPTVSGDRDGGLRVCLPGADHQNQACFIEALGELFDPLRDPRYLIFERQRYLAVPTVLARQRREAEAFAASWRTQVGPATLIYTRSGDGRLQLLRAKEQLLAGFTDWRIERRQRWQAG